MKNLKRLFYFYERAYWYIAQAKSELLKPLGFWNETVLVLTLLSVRYHFDPTITQIVIGYLMLSIFGLIGGKILSITGVIHYNTSLGNLHSPEIMEIIIRLKRMEEKIDEMR